MMIHAIESALHWVYPVLNVVLIVLVATRRNLRGRSWLMAFLAIDLVVGMIWRIPHFLSPGGQSDFLSWFALPLNLAGAVGYGMLIPFVVAVAAGPQVAGPPAAGPAVGATDAPPMTVGRALFSFEGRMRRSDYWLKGALVMIPIGIFNNILMYGTRDDGAHALAIVIGLASLWPGLALMAKRLHDRNRSAWFIATLLIPVANLVFVIWITIEVWFLRGTVGPNRFGDDPVGSAPAAATPAAAQNA